MSNKILYLILLLLATNCTSAIISNNPTKGNQGSDSLEAIELHIPTPEEIAKESLIRDYSFSEEILDKFSNQHYTLILDLVKEGINKSEFEVITDKDLESPQYITDLKTRYKKAKELIEEGLDPKLVQQFDNNEQQEVKNILNTEGLTTEDISDITPQILNDQDEKKKYIKKKQLGKNYNYSSNDLNDLDYTQLEQVEILNQQDIRREDINEIPKDKLKDPKEVKKEIEKYQSRYEAEDEIEALYSTQPNPAHDPGYKSLSKEYGIAKIKNPQEKAEYVENFQELYESIDENTEQLDRERDFSRAISTSTPDELKLYNDLRKNHRYTVKNLQMADRNNEYFSAMNDEEKGLFKDVSDILIDNYDPNVSFNFHSHLMNKDNLTKMKTVLDSDKAKNKAYVKFLDQGSLKAVFDAIEKNIEVDISQFINDSNDVVHYNCLIKRNFQKQGINITAYNKGYEHMNIQMAVKEDLGFYTMLHNLGFDINAEDKFENYTRPHLYRDHKHAYMRLCSKFYDNNTRSLVNNINENIYYILYKDSPMLYQALESINLSRNDSKELIDKYIALNPGQRTIALTKIKDQLSHGDGINNNIGFFLNIIADASTN